MSVRKYQTVSCDDLTKEADAQNTLLALIFHRVTALWDEQAIVKTTLSLTLLVAAVASITVEVVYVTGKLGESFVIPAQNSHTDEDKGSIINVPIYNVCSFDPTVDARWLSMAFGIPVRHIPLCLRKLLLTRVRYSSCSTYLFFL